MFEFNSGDIHYVDPPTRENAEVSASLANKGRINWDSQALPLVTACLLTSAFAHGEIKGIKKAEEKAKKEINGFPRLHVDIPVDGCNCGGCYGYSDSPLIAIPRHLYNSWNEKEISATCDPDD